MMENARHDKGMALLGPFHPFFLVPFLSTYNRYLYVEPNKMTSNTVLILRQAVGTGEQHSTVKLVTDR